MHATIVELDSLTDPVWSPPEDHDFFAIGRSRFTFLLIGRIEIRSVGFKFRGTGIYAFVGDA